MDMSRFTVATPNTKQPELYAHYINKTAVMLFGGDENGKAKKGKYLSVHRMVQKWSQEKIIHRYDLATKHSGNMRPDIYWFWQRKLDRAK